VKAWNLAGEISVVNVVERQWLLDRKQGQRGELISNQGQPIIVDVPWGHIVRLTTDVGHDVILRVGNDDQVAPAASPSASELYQASR